MSEVRSPRVFGRPLWAWTGALTLRGSISRDGRFSQPWYCRIGQRVLWPLCRWLTGHRQAAGERGYGGGGRIDVFCAYCHYQWQVPASEMPSAGHLVEIFHSEAV